MTLSPGTRLGPYEIQSAIGAGGMGEVYRARDARLERTVAIKILPEHLSSRAELRARFEREARAASALNHPHICHLYDIGSQDGIAYLVMEYLEGESLADRLQKGALTPKQAMDFGIQIAEALAMAHRAGILHRDLKPGNVMLTVGGAKLLDFGLAKESPTLSGVSGAAVSGMTPSTPTMTIAELSSPARPLTRQGTVVGTFQYMAPEVLQGAEADARSDIFSLGCVLYEMVTGRRAFEGKSQLSVLTGILEKDPEPVSQVQPTSPAALDYVVKTCLEKNPEERFQTAHDVKLQLQWIANGDLRVRGPQQAPAYLRPRWLAIGVALVLGVAILGAYLGLAPRAGPVVRSFILPPSGTSFVTMAPSAAPPVISPDGNRLVFGARDDKGKTSLYLRALNSVTPALLPGTEDASYPFWSPDSQEIAFFAGGKLKKIAAGGGPPQVLCDATNGRGGAWSKAGVIVFAPGATLSLFRVSADGGVPELATKLQTDRAENSHRWPYFLPDGQHFLFWARNSRGVQEHAVYVGTLGSLDAKLVMKSQSTAQYVPDYLLFMREQTLMAQRFNARSYETIGPQVPIAEDMAINAPTNRPIFSASNNGTLVYQTGGAQGGWRLLWFTRDGKQDSALTDLGAYSDPAISPDGTRVAVGVLQGGTGDVWIFDLARKTKTRLTFGAGIQRYPVWTPDGKTIFYASNGRGLFQILSKAADGSGPEQVVIEGEEALQIPLSVSPDKHYLVYMRLSPDRKTGTDLWAVPLVGERKPFPIVQTVFDDREAEISPDGKWMAYQNNESGRSEVYVTAFPRAGAKWQASTNGGTNPRWRGNGKELYFLDPADNVTAVDVNSDGDVARMGTPRILFHPAGIQVPQGPYSVSADGKRFLINSGDIKEESRPLTLVQNWQSELKK
jgi:serine/threonine protein kinase/Tol biopolymer transport system component